MISIISRLVLLKEILSTCLHDELKYITGSSKLNHQISIQRRTLADEGHREGEEEEEVLSDVFDEYLSPELLANERSHGAPALYHAKSACRCCKCSRALAKLLDPTTVHNEYVQKSDELTEALTENIQSEKIVDDNNFQPKLNSTERDIGKSVDVKNIIVKIDDELNKDADDAQINSIYKIDGN